MAPDPARGRALGSRPMRIPDFQLERFFARYEFSVPYLLCASDV